MKLIDKLIDRKSEPAERKSLLPNNATPLERAVEGTHARLDQVPVPINDLYSPQRIPGEIIPFMAWSVALNDYNEDWPDSVKRSMIENSYILHAHKGTKWAIQRALDLIGIKAEIEEWYEYGGLPYHFRMTIYGDDQNQQFVEQTYYDLFRTVYDKKNARSWLGVLEINFTLDLPPIHIGIGVVQSSYQSVDIDIIDDNIENSNLYLYCGIGVVQSSYQTVELLKYSGRKFSTTIYIGDGMARRRNIILHDKGNLK